MNEQERAAYLQTHKTVNGVKMVKLSLNDARCAYPVDAELWQLIAYSVGVGGSILVVGSSAGVALMGLEKVEFGWYLQNVSGSVLAGYLAGLATYLVGAHVLP